MFYLFLPPPSTIYTHDIIKPMATVTAVRTYGGSKMLQLNGSMTLNLLTDWI
jgi:hypothetical protein